MSGEQVALNDAEFLRDAGMDGVKWAAGFKAVAERLGHHGMDEGWLIGWFCNAIMAGYDEAGRRNRETASVSAELSHAAADVLAWFDLCRPDLAGHRIHRLRYALAAHDNPALIEAGLREAFEAGAMSVHQEWLRAHSAGEGPPRGDPGFGEAASDYAALRAQSAPLVVADQPQANGNIGPKTTSERDGEARIEGDQIAIRVRIANLQCIALGGWAAGGIEPIRIDDPAAFAAELCRALNDEAEDGTTPVHRLFDEAFTASIENGAGELIDDEEAEDILATFKETGGAA